MPSALYYSEVELHLWRYLVQGIHQGTFEGFKTRFESTSDS